jgi:amino acid transporter
MNTGVHGSSGHGELKRSLSLPLITLYGLGTIVGAGIYVLIGEVAGQAGFYAPIAFLVAALVAGVTAFTYAELVSRHPRSAAEAVYVEAAFGRRWLATLAGWAVVAVGVVSSATIANGFVGYLQFFVGIPGWLAISALILLLGALAAWGISESAWAAAAMTILELLGLLIVLLAAGDSLTSLPQRLPELLPPFEWAPWSGIVLGAFLAFYAFIGFEDMVNVAEEVKNPRRNLPVAIVLALLISSTLYLLIAVVSVLTLPPGELAGSGAPLAHIVERAGWSPHTIVLISLVAVINGALVQIIMASRMTYGMALQGTAPALFASVHDVTRTPLNATVFITLVVLVFALWLPLLTLAKITSFITLSLFALMNAALWRLKRKDPKPPGIFRCPDWLPVTGFVICIGLLLLQIGWRGE